MTLPNRCAREQNAQSNDGFAARIQGLLSQLQRERSFPDRLLVHENARAHFVATAPWRALIEERRQKAVLAIEKMRRS